MSLYLTAAFTGLRGGELIALRWRDVDFAASSACARYSAGALTTPKSGQLRSVPMAPQVAEMLARLGRTATDDALVFLGESGISRRERTSSPLALDLRGGAKHKLLWMIVDRADVALLGALSAWDIEPGQPELHSGPWSHPGARWPARSACHFASRRGRR